MGFSIGKLLGGIAPILGAVFGGPPGAALGAAVGAAFTGVNGAVGVASQTGPTAAAVRGVPLPRFPGGPFPSPTAIGTGILSVVASLLFKAREFTGRRVTRQQIADAVRVCGIETAATMFGLTEGEICTIVISKRRRRARGISAADLRRTRSTIRKVHNISHDLRALVPRVRAHHR